MKFAFLIATLALSACGAPGSEPVAQTAAPRTAESETVAPEAPKMEEAVPQAVERPAWLANTRIVSNGGSYALHVAPDPGTLPDNDTFQLDVWVCDARSGMLAGDVTLSIDAAMPQHGHGMNRRPIVRRAEDGHFVVEGMYFHMTGRWELYLDVTRAALTERAQCTVELADE